MRARILFLWSLCSLQLLNTPGRRTQDPLFNHLANVGFRPHLRHRPIQTILPILFNLPDRQIRFIHRWELAIPVLGRKVPIRHPPPNEKRVTPLQHGHPNVENDFVGDLTFFVVLFFGTFCYLSFVDVVDVLFFVAPS